MPGAQTIHIIQLVAHCKSSTWKWNQS